MNIALILAGGTGTRVGADIPKQYIKVKDKMIIEYCLHTFFKHEDIDGVQIVADPYWQDRINCAVTDIISELKASNDKWKGFSKPGENRQLSILNGLRDIKKYAGDDAGIFIHDAARPLLGANLIDRCIAAFDGYDGVMPVLPMKDTVYVCEEGKAVSALLDRNTIFAGQAPELYRLGVYYEACMKLMPDKIKEVNGTTEAAILAGLKVATISGDENNYKITTKEDLDNFALRGVS